MKKFLLTTTLFLSGWTVAAEPRVFIELQETSADVESVTAMKSYYNGALTLFSLDHVEPAAKSMEIVVVLPNGEQEGGYVDRKTLSLGWYCSADLSAARATYDAKKGLSVRVPVAFYAEHGACLDQDELNLHVSMDDNAMGKAEAWLSSGRRP